MSEALPLVIIGLAIIVAGYVNYFAFSHIEEKSSRTRNLAVCCGGIGLGLVILTPFAPLLALGLYFNDNSGNGAAILPIIWIGAALFTVLSVLAIITHAIANKAESA